MNIEQETRYLMNKYNVHPHKNLGQNFLVDEESLLTISEGVSEKDTVIEIGPGLGTLTEILLNKAKEVIVIELDSKMCYILEDRFKKYENIKIINEDILKINIDKLATNAKIVANLPYYITTSIITKLLKTKIRDIRILIQKEVADRITAKPGTKDAGAITYFVDYYANAQIIKEVKKEYFIPSPKVESAIVKLEKLDQPRVDVKNEKLLFELIKTNFTKRRKTITNSLVSIIEKEKLVKALNQLNINTDIRGETLSLEEYAKIVNLLDLN